MILRAKCCRRINFKSHKVMLLFIQPSTTLHFWLAFSLWSVMWVLLEVIVFCIYAYLGILPALYFYCWDFSISEEKAMAPHSSTLAWKIPWTKEPGRLQSVRSRRVWHDWAASLSLFTFTHWRRKWQPTPVFLPGKSQGWGSLVAAIYGVAQSRTRLKQLSSSSSSISEPVYTCPTLSLHQGHYMAFNFVCQRINTLHN